MHQRSLPAKAGNAADAGRSPPLEKKSKPIKRDWDKIAVKTNKSGP